LFVGGIALALSGCASKEAAFHTLQTTTADYDLAWETTLETIGNHVDIATADKSLGYVASDFVVKSKNVTPIDVPFGFVAPGALYNQRKRVVGRVETVGDRCAVSVKVQKEREEYDTGQEFSSGAYEGISTENLTEYKAPEEVASRWMPAGSDDEMARLLLKEIEARIKRATSGVNVSN